MTVVTTQAKAIFAGNGSLSQFAFAFVGVAPADLSVIYTDASGNQTTLAPSSYSLQLNAPVAGAVWGVGGTLTYPLSGSPIASGTTLTILRVVPYTQGISLQNQGNYLPASTEQALDLLCMEIQQAEELYGRAIVVAPSDPVPNALPPVAQRAGQYLTFDTNGNPIAALPPSGGAVISAAMQPVVAAATIPAAAALLGVPLAIPVGTMVDFAGVNAPTQWQLCDGGTASRTTYSLMLAAITQTVVGNTHTSTTVDGIASTAGLKPGWPIEGSGFQAGTTINAILSANSIRLSLATTSTLTGISCQAFPWGNGDGATTFARPDFRGRVGVGRDDMGGTPASRVTTTTFTPDALTLNANSGNTETIVLTASQLPAHTHANTLTDPGHTHSYNSVSFGQAQGGTTQTVAAAVVGGTTVASTTGITITNASFGSGAAHPNVQPSLIVNKIIFAGAP